MAEKPEETKEKEAIEREPGSQSESKMRIRAKRNQPLLIALTIILVAGIGLFFVFNQHGIIDDSDGPLTIEDAREESSLLRFSDDTESAIELWADVAKNANDQDELFTAYLEQGFAYYELGRYQEALEAFHKAEMVDGASLDMQRTVYQYMADVNRELGNYQESINYYEKVITKLDKESKLYEADKSGYEQLIEDLKEKIQ